MKYLSIAEIMAGSTPEIALQRAIKEELRKRSFDEKGAKLVVPKCRQSVVYSVKDRGDMVHENRRYIGGFTTCPGTEVKAVFYDECNIITEIRPITDTLPVDEGTR